MSCLSAKRNARAIRTNLHIASSSKSIGEAEKTEPLKEKSHRRRMGYLGGLKNGAASAAALSFKKRSQIAAKSGEGNMVKAK